MFGGRGYGARLRGALFIRSSRALFVCLFICLFVCLFFWAESRVNPAPQWAISFGPGSGSGSPLLFLVLFMFLFMSNSHSACPVCLSVYLFVRFVISAGPWLEQRSSSIMQA